MFSGFPKDVSQLLVAGYAPPTKPLSATLVDQKRQGSPADWVGFGTGCNEGAPGLNESRPGLPVQIAIFLFQILRLKLKKKMGKTLLPRKAM